jgi:hypothetical protein
MRDPAFWIWAVVGFAVGLSAFSLGPLLGIPVVVLVVLLAARPRLRSSAWGSVVAFGALLLLVAYLNRGGHAEQHIDPRPWLVAGIVCVAVGLLGEARRARSA